MKDLIESIKDLFYDVMDYLIIIVVVISVALVLNWRLGILFHGDSDAIAKEGDSKQTTEEQTKTSVTIEEVTDDSTQVSNEEQINDSDSSNQNQQSTVSNNTSGNEHILVNIPQGSSTDKIGRILMENNIITNSRDFSIKASEMKLDTKLRAGKFQIPNNSELEDVIKILANQK